MIKPAFSQVNNRLFENYNWDQNPKPSVTSTDTSNSSIIIFSKNIHEYVYENDVFYEYYIIHKRIKLITSVGIENYNRIYVQVNDEDKVISEKARIIKEDGTISQLGSGEFKEGYDQESGEKYRYFAFEGIEIGCEIEFLYCIRHIPSLQGSIINIQSGVPCLSYEVKYITPQNLWYKFKSFNNCPEAVYDSTQSGKNIWTITADNIPRLKSEEGSALQANLMKYAFKLERNSSTGKKDLYSYGPLASEIYDKIFNSLDSKDNKAITNVLKSIKVDAGSDEENKIRIVENYLKTNFIYDENAVPDNTVLAKVVANKVYSDFGAVRLYANIFKNLGIETEIVLTCDRFENKFDKDFECYAFLDDYLIYFPKIKKYLSPADNFTRLGFPSNEDINTYGLFIKAVSMGDYSTGLGKIKFIEPTSYSDNLDRLTINVNIPSDIINTDYEIERVLCGYTASYYQPLFDFIKDEDKLKEFSESIIKYIDKDGTVEDLKFENNSGNFLGQKPLIAKAKLKSDYFFEKAGNKYLFKVGMLIGPQIELYKKDERHLPLEFPYNHRYIRTIIFNVPDGYKVSNLDQLKFNDIYIRNGNDTSMVFISDYKVDNDMITVSISEYYKEYNYLIGEFEEYRRVANASANFNKVVLIFEPK